MVEPLQASLDGAIARAARAKKHVLDLIARIKAFRDEQEQSCGWAWDTDPKHFGEPKLIVHRYVSIPIDLGVIIGEVCYNLRSALDYLIYELAILDSGKVVDGTQFPIEDKRKGFEWRKNGGWLNGLNTAHVAAIEGMQPYRGCYWTAKLRDISNPDKHRHLALHQGTFQVELWANAERLQFLNLPGKISSAQHPVSGKEVYVQLNFSLQVTFDDGEPVVETLKELQSQVTETLAVFQPEFEPPREGGTHDSPSS